jgi:hypothetical protein
MMSKRMITGRRSGLRVKILRKNIFYIRKVDTQRPQSKGRQTSPALTTTTQAVRSTTKDVTSTLKAVRLKTTSIIRHKYGHIAMLLLFFVKTLLFLLGFRFVVVVVVVVVVVADGVD